VGDVDAELVEDAQQRGGVLGDGARRVESSEPTHGGGDPRAVAAETRERAGLTLVGAGLPCVAGRVRVEASVLAGRWPYLAAQRIAVRVAVTGGRAAQAGPPQARPRVREATPERGRGGAGAPANPDHAARAAA